MGETFRLAMPGESNMLDARRRMEQRLAAAQNGGGPGGFLPALQAVVQARTVAPGTTIQALSFRQGTVEMKLSARDATSLDHMSQSLRSNGWQSDLTSGNTTGSGYEGRIQIRAK
jgi:type II secretory pathway component PulL